MRERVGARRRMGAGRRAPALRRCWPHRGRSPCSRPWFTGRRVLLSLPLDDARHVVSNPLVSPCRFVGAVRAPSEKILGQHLSFSICPSLRGESGRRCVRRRLCDRPLARLRRHAQRHRAAVFRMKCVAKTVSGATAELDIEPTDTLAELKVGRICLTLAVRAFACSGCTVQAWR